MSKSSGKVGAIRSSQIRGETGKSYSFNASLIITTDKREFTKVTNTKLENYKHIPESGRSVLVNIANFMVTKVIPNAFESESVPGGGNWMPLAERTEKWRRAMKAEDSPMLDVSGSLIASLTVANLTTIETKIGKEARLIISPHGIKNNPRNKSAGNELTKFYVHNLGSDTVPPRPFMPDSVGDLDSSDKREIRRRVEEGYNDYLSGYKSPRKGKK